MTGRDNHPGFDEDALRQMLHGAVDELAPAPDALKRLQHGVPARRARKRQLIVVAVASVVLIGTGIPAAMNTGIVTGHGERKGVASDSHTLEGADQGEESAGESQGTRDTAGTKDKEKSGEATEEPSKGKASDNSSAGGVTPASVPECTTSQLGAPDGSTAPADDSGRVSGSFTYTNISGSECVVPGDGTVHASAPSGNVIVAQHSTGDGATGLLPPPAAAPAEVDLQPGESYMVQFAFVPSGSSDDGCPSGGSSPSPDKLSEDSAESAQSSDAGTGDNSDTSSTSGGEEPPTGEGVALTHTPDAGSGEASTTVPDVCSGTVYYTPAMPAS